MAPQITLALIKPEIMVASLAVIVLLMGLFRPLRSLIIPATLLGLILTFYYALTMWGKWGTGFNNMVVRDPLSLSFDYIFLTGALLSVLISSHFFRRIVNQGEYIALMLFSTVGMMLMALAGDLIVLFLGLETMSIALYVLVGFRRANEKSLEAALKYFLLGAFATGFLLYGMAFMYGSTGTTNLRMIISLLKTGSVSPGMYLYIGMGLLLVGFGFKVALVPFHSWTPDVYEGAPTPVTAFMSAGAKGAGFAAFLRVFLEAAGSLHASWTPLLWMIAVVTMTLGNVAALTQTNIKRMLAYSSIAHAGYVLMGIVAATSSAYSAVLFYLLAYTFMKLGAFGLVEYLERKDRETLNISDYAGLGLSRPWVGIAMTIFMLSLAGFPPTIGFIGKFFIFRSAVEAGFIGLTVIAVLNSLVSVYYYIGVVVVMYMREPVIDFNQIPKKPLVATALILACAAILFFGLRPDSVMAYLMGAF